MRNVKQLHFCIVINAPVQMQQQAEFVKTTEQAFLLHEINFLWLVMPAEAAG